MAVSQREKWIETKQLFLQGVHTWQFWVGITSVFVFSGIQPILVYSLMRFKIDFGIDFSLPVLILGLGYLVVTIRNFVRFAKQAKQRRNAGEPKVMNWLLGPALVGSLFLAAAGFMSLMMSRIWIDLSVNDQAKAALMFLRHAYGL
jgi:hypothetical protein